MTPVATPVALCAVSWDAALEETLSGSTPAPSRDPRRAGRGVVHSVHDRAVNIRCAAGLIALAHESLDDAPCTIRIAADVWPAIASARVGDAASLRADAVTLHTPAGEVRVALPSAGRRVLAPTAGTPSPEGLRTSLAVLDAIAAPAAVTAFGDLVADRLAAGIHRLRGAAEELLTTGTDDAAAAAAGAAERLLGLGEGLTPSGDDMLTGLAFTAAHRGFGLAALRTPLRAAIATADRRTTLLSAVTLREALAGRARARLHALLEGVIDGDAARIHDAAIRTAQIGHTSGHDILTGIRLAVALSAGRLEPSTEGDHR